jgi:trigger factor
MNPATGIPELKIDVEEPQTWARELTITVPAERVDQERQAVTRRLRERVRLPGFRKGRVPQGVLDRQFGPTIRDETVERVVNAAFREAIQEKGLRPITEGHVDDVEYEPGAALKFRVRFEVRPEITLGRLGGFRVQRPARRVDEKEAESVLQRLRSDQAEWHAVEDTQPKPGDRVVVEITALSEAAGEQPSPRPRRYEIVLGQGEAVPDVEAAIQTLTAGASGEFLIQVPADEEGKPAEERRVRIELQRVDQADLPALDDEFARKAGDFASLAELRERIAQDLTREAETEAERVIRRTLLDQVIEANPFDVPDSMVSQYVLRMFPPTKGVPEERVEELRQAARPAAERAIRRSLVIERIAEMNDLRATAEEVDARVEEIAQRNNRQAGEVWAQLQRTGRLEGVESEIMEEKVFSFLETQSTIEDAPAAEQPPAQRAKD